MAWNEPGRGQDPWGGRRKDAGPPDLDELVRNLQRKLSGLFGGGGGRSGNGGSATFLMGVLAILVWCLFGFYQVDAKERGVVQRFGRYVEPPTEPGLRWHLPWPIETVTKVDVEGIRSASLKTQMLTNDENLVRVELTVQYRVAEPVAFLFNVRDPETTVVEVSESAIREVVGRTGIDELLGTEAVAGAVAPVGRDQLVVDFTARLQDTLRAYQTGIEVSSVNVQQPLPPEPVQAAFDDVTKAREDRQRLIAEAQAYANDVVPRARGQAARALQEAQGYRERVVAEANGESSRFLALLKEYQNAPGVTRERLYLETMQQVLGNTAKIVIDSEKGGNMMYLPLDELLKDVRRGGANAPSATAQPAQPDPDAAREAARTRGGR
jgi:membrane protease subunit HflK